MRQHALQRHSPWRAAHVGDLLAQRLRKLEQIGVVERVHGASANEYRLTAAGEELRPIVMALGHWGARWIGSRLQPGQLDAGLMWDVRRFVQLANFRAGAVS